MDEQERLETLRKLKELRALRDQRTAGAPRISPGIPEPTAPAQAESARPKHEATWTDRARAGLQGMTLGWSDEIGAGLAAAAAKLGGEERSFGDVYDEMHESLQLDREAYERDNAGEALALNIAGGLLTGGAGAGRAAASGTLKTAPGLAKALGYGVAEGAVAGAGAADQDERLAGAAMGGTVGAAFPLAGAGGKGLLKQASKRRVRQKLGEGDDFIPLNIADEPGRLGHFYRNIVGKAPGGRGAILQQSQKHLDEAAGVVDAAEIAQRDLKRTIKREKKGLDRTVKFAAKEADDVATREAQNLRAVAAQESIPDDFRAEVLAGADFDDVHDVSRRIKNWWQNDGFKMVKERQFDWDGSLADDVQKLVNDDPALLTAFGEAPGMVQALERRFGMTDAMEALKKASVRGEGTPAQVDQMFTPHLKMDGDALMEMRNVFARQANKGGDNAFAYRTVADRFDKMIRNQMPEDAVAQFNDQLARWTTQRTYLDAAKRARGEGSQFTPKQWQTSAGKYGDAATGSAPLQGSADEAISRTGLAEAKAKQVKGQKPDRLEALNIDDRVEAAAGVLKKARAAQTAAKGAVPTADVGPINQLALTALLGAPGLAAGPAGLLTGVATAKGLSTEGAQRTLAGQTGMQRRLAQWLRQYERGDKIPMWVRRAVASATRREAAATAGD